MRNDEAKLTLKAQQEKTARLRLDYQLAGERVVLSAKKLTLLLELEQRYNLNQPRVPAGQSGGGQWTNGGAGGGAAGGHPSDGGPTSSGANSASRQQVVRDETGSSPWDYFVNTYAVDGALSEQALVGRDGSKVGTYWDTTGIAPVSLEQTFVSPTGLLVTNTTLNRDGSATILFGESAASMLALSGQDGSLVLQDATLTPAMATLALPAAGDNITLFGGSGALLTRAGLATAGVAGGTFAFGMTAFTTSAGDVSTLGLSNTLRIAMFEDANPPQVQQWVAGGMFAALGSGSWKAVSGVDVTHSAGGTLAIDAAQLRQAIGPDKMAEIIRNPSYGEGVTIDPPAPLINVITPVPVANSEVLNIPEFRSPNHTGSPPVVVNTGPFITPIPNGSPFDYAVYSVRAEEFSKAGGWQGAAVSESSLKAQNPSVAIIENAWRAANANLGGFSGTAASGTKLHAEVARILKEKGYLAEVSVSPDGDPYIRYGKPGSIRIDVSQVRGNDLYIFDFKAGKASLSRSRIRQITERAKKLKNEGRSFGKITIIEVKL